MSFLYARMTDVRGDVRADDPNLGGYRHGTSELGRAAPDSGDVETVRHMQARCWLQQLWEETEPMPNPLGRHHEERQMDFYEKKELREPVTRTHTRAEIQSNRCFKEGKSATLLDSSIPARIRATKHFARARTLST